jgi:WD40 repeat protein/serine/threonine protein kinase
MNADDPTLSEEVFAAWLAACDAALASGVAPPALNDADLSPEGVARLERGLAGLRLLDQLRLPRTSPLEERATSSPPGTIDPTAPHNSSSSAAHPPWKSLGRFRLRRELGRGGCGIVYLAHDPLLNRDVALKIPHLAAALAKPMRERFLREARAASGLDHPNVVRVYEAAEVGPVCYIVSAYCPGPTLAEWLKARRDPVPFRDAAKLIAILAHAVAHAHSRGVIHRDLKPANILLQKTEARNPKSEIRNPKSESGGSDFGFRISDLSFRTSDFEPQITDFGLAKLLEPSGDAPTRTGLIMGTANYMSPEQAAGKTHAIGPTSDVYALGAILYELLTGRPPFRGESDLETALHVQRDEPVSPSRLRPRTPRDLQTICLKCLHKEPDRRYASAAALANDLRRYLNGRPIRARPTSALERAGRWCRRNPALAMACGMATAAIAAVVVLSLSLAYRESRAANEVRAREQETLVALQAVREQSNLTQREAALRTLDQGLTECEAGRVRKGMLTLARSLVLAAELPPERAADIEHAARVNLSAWRTHLPALRCLFPHEAVIRAVAFRPDGAEMVTASYDGIVRRWDASSCRSSGPDLRYPGQLNCIAYSPDGKTLAVGGSRGVQLWRAEDGQVLQSLEGIGTAYSVVYSSDGRLLATGGSDAKVRFWHAASAEPAGEVSVSRTIRAAAFTPDNATLVVGCEDGKVHFIDVAARQLLSSRGQCCAKHEHPIYALAISPDGSLLLTGSADETASLWDLKTGQRRGGRFLLHGAVNAVAFHPTRNVFVTTSAYQTSTWDVATGQRVGEPITHESSVCAIALHPDGQSLLAGGFDKAARLWEMTVGREWGRLLPHGSNVQSVAFSPDGLWALTAGFDGYARLWDGATGALQRQLDGAAGKLHAVAFSPDSKTAVAAGDDLVLWTWDVATGQRRPWQRQRGAAIRVLRFSPPDGHWLLSVDEKGTALIWDTAKGEIVREMHHGGEVGSWSAVFSPDGRQILTGGRAGLGALAYKGKARLWDAATGELLREFHHERHVGAVAFSIDGKWIVTGSADHTAQLWNGATGQPIGGPFKLRGMVRSVALNADASRLLTAGFDSSARVWDTTTGKQIAPAAMHEGGVRDATFSPDGQLFVTGSFDFTGRVWDTATGRPVGPAAAFRNWVVSVAFRPDGRAVLLGSSDGTARLLDVAPPVSGDAERIRLWVEVLTGAELEGDALRVLDGATWQERRRRLGELGGVPML